MADAPKSPDASLRQAGKALWYVNFCVGYIQDMVGRVPEDAGADLWEDTVAEDSDMLHDAVAELKRVLCNLPPDLAQVIAQGYAAEDGAALARGDAVNMLANVVRMHPKRGQAGNE